MAKTGNRSGPGSNRPTKKADGTAGSGRPSRWPVWIRTANKKVLAAAGAGVLGLVTAGVLAIPKLIHNLADPVQPLTVNGEVHPVASETGTPGSGDIVEDSGSCGLGGTYLLPAGFEFPPNPTTSSLRAAFDKTPYVDGAWGSYVLQAAAGQAVVVTGIHTVLISRKPAPRATTVHVESSVRRARRRIRRTTPTSISTRTTWSRSSPSACRPRVAGRGTNRSGGSGRR